MLDIILCATQRCGSTLVVEDMRNSGVLGQPEEWFIPWDPAKPDHDWKAAFDSVHRRARGENGVTAVKIMANQLFNLEACLASFPDPASQDRPAPQGPRAAQGDFAHVAAAFRGGLWVWLRRNDVVSQAISRLMAEQTGINHATAQPEDPHFAGNLARGYNPDYNQGAQYRYGAILRHVTAITVENLAWQRFFASHAITPLELVYEDVIADPGLTHLDRMAQGIGQDQPPPRQPRKMVKLANERNAAWLDRFFHDAAEHRFQPPRPAKP